MQADIAPGLLVVFGISLIDGVLGAFLGYVSGIGYVSVSASDFTPEAIQRAVAFFLAIAVAYVAVPGAMLLWSRPKSAANILLVVAGVCLSARFGAAGGLIPLAVLTTRPSSILPEVTRVFE